MNSKKGLTIISVTIIIIVIIIISSTVVITGSGITSKTKLKRFGTEILQVEEAVNQYVKRKSGVIDWEKVTIDETLLTDEEKIQYVEENISTSFELYVVDLKDIGAETVNYGIEYSNTNSKELYLWSEKTNKVYYRKGYNYKDKTYYTLTNELMDLIK